MFLEKAGAFHRVHDGRNGAPGNSLEIIGAMETLKLLCFV